MTNFTIIIFFSCFPEILAIKTRFFLKSKVIGHIMWKKGMNMGAIYKQAIFKQLITSKIFSILSSYLQKFYILNF